MSLLRAVSRRLLRLRLATVIAATLCSLMCVAIYLYGYKGAAGRARRLVNLYVVEEHHEVLEYWFHETVIGNLNNSGNSLIHIDAHSDLAPPQLYKGFPLFTWPKGDGQVFNMMESNDMFIQAAMTVGLFDRLLWVYPSWDASLGPPHERYELDLGIANLGANRSQIFCECRAQILDDGARSDKECTAMYVAGQRGREEAEISREDCHVRRTVYVEKVSEDVFREVVEEWSSRPFVLDVDEDFFGCESGFSELQAAAFPLPSLHAINELVGDLLCVEYTFHEEYADKMLKDYLTKYIELCGLTDPGRRCSENPADLAEGFEKLLEHSFEDEHTMFCADTAVEAQMSFVKLFPVLANLTLDQLSAVRQIGFCLNTSPKTMGFKDGLADYGICTGFNLPEETAVRLHSPDNSALLAQTRSLHTSLAALDVAKLRSVTVCRSVRDGYTPRRLAGRIEDGILGYFREADPHGYNYVYDSNLLGGKEGWEGRYRAGVGGGAG